MVSRTEKCVNCKNFNLLVECACGCGGIRKVRGTDHKERYYIAFHNKKDWIGSNHPSWKGGKKIMVSGYIMVKRMDHPFCDRDGYVYEHRLVMESHLDRYLEPWEDVHHLNEVKYDNRLENLQLLTHGEHTVITHKGMKYNK